jgi:hypothetical protein
MHPKKVTLAARPITHIVYNPSNYESYLCTSHAECIVEVATLFREEYYEDQVRVFVVDRELKPKFQPILEEMP